LTKSGSKYRLTFPLSTSEIFFENHLSLLRLLAFWAKGYYNWQKEISEFASSSSGADKTAVIGVTIK